MYTRRSLFALLAPLVAAQAFPICMGYIDSMMLSHVEEAALSSVSLANTVIAFLIALLAALPVAGTVLVAQSLGGDDMLEARRNAGILFRYSLLFSLASCLAVFFFGQFIIHMLFPGAEHTIQKDAITYLRICAFTLPFSSFMNANIAICRAANNTCVPMLVICAVGVLDIVLSALFLFQFKMGVFGAGLGTLLSQNCGCAALMYYNRSWYASFRQNYAISKSIKRRLLLLAIPHLIENALFYAGRILIASMAASFGTNANAAYAIAVPIDSIAFLMTAMVIEWVFRLIFYSVYTRKTWTPACI